MRPPTAFERLADPEGRRRAADPNLTANGAVRANRAAQFMPFAALTGYYELVRKQEITVEQKRELTEEKALELSQKLEGLKRGDLVRVTYYDTYGYRSRTGILDEALPAFKLLKSPSTSTISRTLSYADEPSDENACARREQCQALRQLQPAIPRPA